MPSRHRHATMFLSFKHRPSRETETLMNRHFWTASAMLIMLAILAAQTATAADEKKSEQTKTVRVRVEKADAEGDAEVKVQAILVDGAEAPEGKKRQIRIRRLAIGDGGGSDGGEKQVRAYAFALGGASPDIEKALKEAGLKGEQLEKAKAAVEKALKGALAPRRVIKKDDGAWHIEMVPRVTVLGADDKKQHIELKVLGQTLKLDGSVNERVIEHKIEGATIEKLREALKEATIELKGQGLDEELLKKIQAAVDQAVKTRQKRIVIGIDADIEKDKGQKYMIGVECAEMDEALREKYGVEEGVGVAVNSVFEGSPAAKAGIKKGDILVKVGEEDLKDAEQLIEAVQKVGSEKKKVSLTILRGKNEKTIVIEPADRKTLGLSLREIDQLQEGLGKTLLQLPHKRMLMIGPGVVTDKAGTPGAKTQADEIKKLRKQVEDLTKQVKQLQAAVKKMQSDD